MNAIDLITAVNQINLPELNRTDTNINVECFQTIVRTD